MNKFVLSVIAAFALCVATAVAQSGNTGAQGTQGSSPTMSQTPGANPQPGASQPGSYPSDQNSGSTGNNQAEKGEKKLKGCVQAQGGQATLETKKGKEIALTGQDVSAHNGHEVEVKGAWASGSMSQSSAGSSGEKTFNVTDVKMISETCKGSKEKGSSSMGTGATGTSPSGSGSSTGSSPSGTGSTSGSTQPQ
jgi:hypothetical protein